VTTGDGSWCVQVDVDADRVDVSSGRLWSAGATSVHEVDLGDGRVRLVAGVPADGLVRLETAVSDLSPVAYKADYDGWLDAWRPFARPVRVGRILIHPSWEESEAQDGDLVVSIDAQQAFGQGNHPTTRLVLAEMARLVEPGATVLDVGCGSGILGVVGAMLGASRVVAVDLESSAVESTRANAARNGVDAVVEVSDSPVEEITGEFDLVLANILPSVLVDLSPTIAARVAPGGAVVLSGLLADQRDRVVAAYESSSAGGGRPLTVRSETELDDWFCLVLTPPP
jgi:ribosomal protein L11 methyltransferase